MDAAGKLLLSVSEAPVHCALLGGASRATDAKSAHRILRAEAVSGARGETLRGCSAGLHRRESTLRDVCPRLVRPSRLSKAANLFACRTSLALCVGAGGVSSRLNAHYKREDRGPP